MCWASSGRRMLVRTRELYGLSCAGRMSSAVVDARCVGRRWYQARIGRLTVCTLYMAASAGPRARTLSLCGRMVSAWRVQSAPGRHGGCCGACGATLLRAAACSRQARRYQCKRQRVCPLCACPITCRTNGPLLLVYRCFRICKACLQVAAHHNHPPRTIPPSHCPYHHQSGIPSSSFPPLPSMPSLRLSTTSPPPPGCWLSTCRSTSSYHRSTSW